ncbi:catalase [Fusarium heterosporum]|uniref:Catalase n=1 Tax=Fusarium heterosporum TaxID=42747 RepID=A0A8H5TDD7_FUSHE|nr:catalase [Fusarium heterosporum]
MDDTWESEFLSSRHVHNRQSRKSTNRNAGRSNVLHAFGSYEIRCPKAEDLTHSAKIEKSSKSGPKAPKKRNQRTSGPRLDIHQFTDDEDGLLGSLCLPRVLDATVILAGSRKTLQTLIVSQETSAEDSVESLKSPGAISENSEDESSLLSSEDDSAKSSNSSDHLANELPVLDKKEAKERRRFDNFEKNTFRQPKFWFSWTGVILCSPDTSADADSRSAKEDLQSGMGYLVFSGSKYAKFQGTISCDVLGWKDVTIEGRKQ